jgi:hypothetical protein
LPFREYPKFQHVLLALDAGRAPPGAMPAAIEKHIGGGHQREWSRLARETRGPAERVKPASRNQRPIVISGWIIGYMVEKKVVIRAWRVVGEIGAWSGVESA